MEHIPVANSQTATETKTFTSSNYLKLVSGSRTLISHLNVPGFSVGYSCKQFLDGFPAFN